MAKLMAKLQQQVRRLNEAKSFENRDVGEKASLNEGREW